MATQPQVILLEFNELCPALMDKFIAQRKLPNFERLRQESQVYVTDAEEASPALEPWIQWITVHTGLSYKEHGVFDLGDGHKLKTPRLWDLAGRAGLSSWVCGSMNTAFQPPFQGFFLPDPWSTGMQPFPAEELAPYYDFIARNVQEYTRDRVPLSATDYRRFLTFMITHGLSAATASRIISQLLQERTAKEFRWQRATILDRLQWDVFAWYQSRHQPSLSTFFLNSTAHFQHIYWRNMDSEPFQIKPTADEQRTYENAVLLGYERMDDLVGRCLDSFGDRCQIVFASALSQQPCLSYEQSGGKKFYRVTDPEKLYRFAGVQGSPKFSPVMSEQFHLYCDSAQHAGETVAALCAVRLADGQPAIAARADGSEVFGGCRLFSDVDNQAALEAGGKKAAFYDLFYRVDGTKSGMHHPDGIFWVRTLDRAHHVHPGKVSLRAVAPTVLSLLGLPKPAHMTGEAVTLAALAAV